MMPLTVFHDHDDDAVFVQVKGEVDVAVDDEFDSHLKQGLAAASGQAGRLLIVDLRGVDFLGSGGLRALVQCHEDGVIGGIAVRMVVTTPIVLRVLEVTQLDRVFALHLTVNDALQLPARLADYG